MLGHHHLLSEGTQIEGVVLEWKPAPLARTKDRLRIGVKFDDGETAEFTEDITNYCHPPAHGLRGLIANAARDTVIPVSLIEGAKVPVRYDPDDRNKLAIDVPALHERVVQGWSEGRKTMRDEAEAVLDAQSATSRASTASGQGGAPDADALAKVAELHRRGDLSDEEFTAAKRDIIGG